MNQECLFTENRRPEIYIKTRDDDCPKFLHSICNFCLSLNSNMKERRLQLEIAGKEKEIQNLTRYRM